MMTHIEVFICAAAEDAASIRALGEALTTTGIACFAAGEGSPSETVAALESARALVFVSSAAANASADVIRALERAAARGIPIITYAIDEVRPSASISYFTATVTPIEATRGGDARRQTSTLVEAVKRALSASPHRRTSARPDRPRYSRAAYKDARRMQRGFAGLLALSACVNAFVLYYDAGFGIKLLQEGNGAATVSATDHLGYMPLASGFGAYVVLICTIVSLRRARLNLLALFVSNIRMSGSEIVWRSLVPFANVFWMERMAADLWNAAGSDVRGAAGPAVPLARHWRNALLSMNVLGVARDVWIRQAAGDTGTIIGLSVALGASHIAAAALTYVILARLLERVRLKHRPGIDAPRMSSPAAMPSVTADVLVAYVPDDEWIASSVARALEENGCRCWAFVAGCDTSAPPPADLGRFAALFVLVTRASHSSQPIASLAQRALTSQTLVIPFVVESPPTGSALGYYTRSLHWVDGAAGVAALRTDGIRASLATRVGRDGAIDTAAFLRMNAAPGRDASYRQAPLLVTTARLLAIVQAAAGCFAAIIAVAIAAFPEGTDASAPLNITVLLIAASLPAWGAFLAWLWVTEANCRALLIRVPGSRARRLVQLSLPGVSLAAGGRAIRRLWNAIEPTSGEPAEALDRDRSAASRIQAAWLASGLTWTAAAILAWYQAAAGEIVAAMLASAAQSTATLARGVVRAYVIRHATSRLESRARSAMVDQVSATVSSSAPV